MGGCLPLTKSGDVKYISRIYLCGALHWISGEFDTKDHIVVLSDGRRGRFQCFVVPCVTYTLDYPTFVVQCVT